MPVTIESLRNFMHMTHPRRDQVEKVLAIFKFSYKTEPLELSLSTKLIVPVENRHLVIHFNNRTNDYECAYIVHDITPHKKGLLPCTTTSSKTTSTP